MAVNKVKRPEKHTEPVRRRWPALVAGMLGGLLLTAALAALGLWWLRWEQPYRAALAARDGGDYPQAQEAFAGLGTYKDAADQLLRTRYQRAATALAAGRYDEALSDFTALLGYFDAAKQIRACRYGQAGLLMEQGRYMEALALYDGLRGYPGARDGALTAQLALARLCLSQGDYTEAEAWLLPLARLRPEAPEMLLAARYGQAGRLAEAGRKYEALLRYTDLQDYEDASARARALCAADLDGARTLAASSRHIMRLRADGTVAAEGDDEYGQCDVSEWKDIVSLAAGDLHTAGLTLDGRVVAAGSNARGQCDVQDWRDGRQVVCTAYATAALRGDGTVLCTDPGFDVSAWQGVVALAAGRDHLVALLADGTLVAWGQDDFGQCRVAGLTGVAAVATGPYRTLVIFEDGSAQLIGLDGGLAEPISGWQGCVAASLSMTHALGRTSDGHVLASGESTRGQCDVTVWSDIVQIVAAGDFSLGLDGSGTVWVAGRAEPMGWRAVRVWAYQSPA